MPLIEVARFQDGAGAVRLEYNAITLAITLAITAIEATVQSGALALTLTRKNGQARSLTLGVGEHRSTNIPPGAQLDQAIDLDSGLLAITIARGNSNIALACSWSA